MTIDRKKAFQKLKRPAAGWAKDWTIDKEFEELFLVDPTELLQTYLNKGKEENLLGLRIGRLQSWNISLYVNDALNQNTTNINLVKSAAQYAWAATEAKAVTSAKNLSKGILLTEAAQYASFCAMANAQQATLRIGSLLYRGLDTELLDMRKSDEHDAGSLYRHFWFVMHLYCDVLQLPLDVSQYSYPASMAPYDRVLADWQTTNPNRVTEFVLAMADFHLEHAGYRAHDQVDEFDDELGFVFPYEILFFLRLRQWQGLANPAEFGHPLMDQPLGRLPDAPAEQPPLDELLQRVIERFRQSHPEAFA